MLAELETARGRYRAAHAAAVSAADAASATGWGSRLSMLTLSLLRFDELARARRLILEADWNSPDVLRQAPVLAQHLDVVGDHASVRDVCSRVRTRLAPDARLEYVDGLAARNLGDGDAASVLFERAVAIDPHFAPAHWSLAYHAPLGLARLPRLEAAHASTAPGSPAAADLAYALYRENEAAGRFDDAWTWLAGGAGAKAMEARSVRWRGHTGIREPAPMAPPTTTARIVFIVGLPRSGTTVLERILGNHSRVHAAGELNAFHAALCEVSDTFLPSPATTRAVPDVGGADDVGGLYRAAIATRTAGGRIVVDKNPANFLYASLVARALPEARILCLRRAPMDACFSNLRELFEGDAYGYSYDLDALADQYAWFESARGTFERAMPGRFMSVHYEALVADPRREAERILGFCGLDYEEGCERIERNATPVSTASSSQVREPIHARGVGAWTRYRSSLEPLHDRLVEHGIEP